MIRMIVFASLVAVNVAWAAAPPPPASAEVRRWIEQLGHREYSVRDNAQRQLEARGPAVRNALRLRERTAELEMRLRIERLLKKCEPAYDLLPRRVNARFVRTPLAEVIRQIAWQTDLPTVLSDGPLRGSPHFTGTFDNTPYWQALDTVARQCQLRVDLRAGTREEFAVILKPGVPQRHVHYWNSLRLVVHKVGTQSLRDPADQHSSGHPLVGVKLWVFAEPGRLELNAYDRKHGQVDGTNQAGKNFAYLNPIIIDQFPYVLYPARYRITSMETHLESRADQNEKHESKSFAVKKYVLIPPKGKNSRIETLSGRFPLHVAHAEEIFRIPFAPKRGFTLGGIRHAVCQIPSEAVVLEVLCEPPLRGGYWCEFHDNDGRKIPRSFGKREKQNETTHWVVSHGHSRLPSMEMRVSHHRSQDIEVPFEFRDIPLP